MSGQTLAVSVIIPFLNGEKYLRNCLMCLTHQFSELAYEIILVDNGSNDGSKMIAEEWADKFPEIKYVYLTEKGVSNARNVGISMAQGEYVYFMDVDDLLRFESLEFLYRKAKSLGLDALGFGVDRLPISKVPEWMSSPVQFDESKCNLEIKIFDGQEYLLHAKGLIGSNAGVWKYLLRRESLLNADLRFDTNLVYFEDAFFLWQFFLKAKKVGIIDFTAYYYVVNPESCLNKSTPEISARHASNAFHVARFFYSNKVVFENEMSPEMQYVFNALIENLVMRGILMKLKSGISQRDFSVLRKELKREGLLPVGAFSKGSPFLTKDFKWKVYELLVNNSTVSNLFLWSKQLIGPHLK